ncbi:MAG: response regulator [Chlamydiota bacterium]|nr:response regulator [Chlamydiota bacterium]
MPMNARILIVDDEIDMAELLKARLEGRGYEVHLEHDGASGLEKAKEMMPDLMILDVMLPKIDGYKICRLLKFDDKYKSIPIIMFTALGQESDVTLGMEVGADAYFTKPLDHKMFLEKLEELLKKDASEHE